MLKRSLWAGVLLVLLTACATGPTVQPTQVVTVCPRLPALEPLDPETQAALALDFTATIQRLLSGLPPLAISYELPSTHVVPSVPPTSKP